MLKHKSKVYSLVELKCLAHLSRAEGTGYARAFGGEGGQKGLRRKEF